MWRKQREKERKKQDMRRKSRKWRGRWGSIRESKTRGEGRGDIKRGEALRGEGKRKVDSGILWLRISVSILKLDQVSLPCPRDSIALAWSRYRSDMNSIHIQSIC